MAMFLLRIKVLMSKFNPTNFNSIDQKSLNLNNYILIMIDSYDYLDILRREYMLCILKMLT